MKPREFLVQPFNSLVDGDTGLCIAFPAQNEALNYLNIHVIEYSAYAKLKAALEYYATQNHPVHGDDFNTERAREALAEVEKPTTHGGDK
jgi:hypothetical protein